MYVSVVRKGVLVGLVGDLGRQALTRQLLYALFVGIRPCCAETDALICVGAVEDRHFGEAALGDADLRVFFEKDSIDCAEPF